MVRKAQCFTPSILSLGFFSPTPLPLPVYWFVFLFLFSFPSVCSALCLIFLTAVDAQPTPPWETESLNERVGDEEPDSSHTVNNYRWSLKEKHEPCELGGDNSLCNLGWAAWTLYLRCWARGRLDPFHITYPACVPTDFPGFSKVKEVLELQDSQSTSTIWEHSSCYLIWWCHFPLLFTEIEKSVHMGDAPLAWRHKASWRRSLGRVDVCCCGMGSQCYLSAPKSSINWKCSCYLKSQYPSR